MKSLNPVFCAIGICAYGALLGTALAAAEPVGSAIIIKQDVFGFGADGTRDLSVSDAVYRNEEISASSKSHGELELSDGSKIIVGENSIVLLDDFVLGEKGFKSGTIRVVKGAFRFVTGSSKKGAFTVKTPLATIGVRGTFFDVYVGDGKETVVLFRGEVRVCSGTNCQIARRSCDVIEISPSGIVEKAPFFGSRRADSTERDYNLVNNQERFTKPLRAPKVLCNARAAMESQLPARANPNAYFGPRGGGNVTGSVGDGGPTDTGGGRGNNDGVKG